jgi:hypothetical protein
MPPEHCINVPFQPSGRLEIHGVPRVPWRIWLTLTVSRGDHRAAHAACCEALEIFAGLGHRRGIARVLEGSARLAMAQGNAERALKLAAAAAQLRQLISAPLRQAEQSKLEQTLLPAWKSLDETQGKRAWAEGSAMSLEEAIQYSLEGPGFPASG